MHRGACPLHLLLPLLSSIVCVCFPIKIRFALVGVRLQRRPIVRPIVTMNDDTARAGAIANVVHNL
jgi:hypothetical protein